MSEEEDERQRVLDRAVSTSLVLSDQRVLDRDEGTSLVLPTQVSVLVGGDWSPTPSEREVLWDLADWIKARVMRPGAENRWLSRIERVALRTVAEWIRARATRLEAGDPSNQRIAELRALAASYELEARDDDPDDPSSHDGLRLIEGRAARPMTQAEQRRAAARAPRPNRRRGAAKLVEQALQPKLVGYQNNPFDDVPVAFSRFIAALDLITAQFGVKDWASIKFNGRKWVGSLRWRDEQITAGALHAAWKRYRSDFAPRRGEYNRSRVNAHAAARNREWVRAVLQEHSQILDAKWVGKLIDLARAHVGRSLGGVIVHKVVAFPYRPMMDCVIWRERANGTGEHPFVALGGRRVSPKMLESALKMVQREERSKKLRRGHR